MKRILAIACFGLTAVAFAQAVDPIDPEPTQQAQPVEPAADLRVERPEAAKPASHYKIAQGTDFVYYAYIIEQGETKSIILPEPPRVVAVTTGGVIGVGYTLDGDSNEANLKITGKAVGSTTLCAQTTSKELVMVLCQVVKGQDDYTRYQKRFKDISDRLRAP